MTTAQLASAILDRASRDEAYRPLLTSSQWTEVGILMSRLMMEQERMHIVTDMCHKSEAAITRLVEQNRDGETTAVTLHARGSAARRILDLLELVPDAVA